MEHTNEQRVKLNIQGMHCVSCAMNIDGALEDLEGVIQSETSYAKSTTIVAYDPGQQSLDAIIAEIQKLDYTASVAEEK
ncbi:MAG: cation transporter [bacterium]|nr:cation transporter [bacterium]